MNYEKSFLITCEFMAAKVLILLFCATTIIVELCLAQESMDESGGFQPIRDTQTEINFLTEPEDVVVKPGENATFHCLARTNSEEKPMYSWKFNNEIVKEASPDGTLFINAVPAKRKKKVNGGYQCIVNTSLGSLVSRIAKLKISDVVLPFVEKSPVQIEAWEGFNYRLSCESSPVPDSQITWYAKNKPVPLQNDKLMIVDKNLYVNKVQKSDVGEYRCQWKHPDSNKLAHISFTVSIVDPPGKDVKLDFIQPELPKNLTLERGQKIPIHCHTNKANSVVFWTQVEKFKRGGTVINSKLDRKSYSTMLFAEGKEDKYSYMCVAEDEGEKGKEIYSSVVGFTVGEAPKIVSLSKSQSTSMMGVPIRFYCNVSGYPVPTVKWFHNSNELDGSLDHRVTINSNFLVVRDMQLSDAGVYQCMGENVFGSASSATVLEYKIEEKLPPKVTDVQCTPISTSEIQITFNSSQDSIGPGLPFREGDVFSDPESEVEHEPPKMVIEAFVVSYFQTADKKERDSVIAVNGSTIVYKLRPDTMYSFVVRRYNGKQGSEPSEEVSCATKSTNALKLTTARIFNNSLFLAWQKLQAKSFKIVARNKNDPTDKVVERETSNDFVILTNLTYNAQYEIEVSSHPKQNAYEPIIIRIGGQIYTKSKFQIYKINESSVVFIWSLADSPDILNGFQIKYRKLGQPSTTKEAFLSTNETSFIAHNLSPGESYEVSLYVVIGDDEGSETTELDRIVFKTHQKTKPATLPPPNPPECYVISSEIRYVWFYPWDVDGPMYLVKFRARGSDDVQLKVTQAKHFIFLGLTGDQEYEMSVRIFNDKDESSNYTKPLVCKTKSSGMNTVELEPTKDSLRVPANDSNENEIFETMPGKVYNISYTQIGSDSARLSWGKPEKFDELENHYIVSYGVRNRTNSTERRAIDTELPYYNTTEITVPGDQTSVVIPQLDVNVEYVIMIRTENSKTKTSADSPRKIIMLKYREKEINDEKTIGLIIGIIISSAFVLVCVISAICGKKLLKTYYYQRNDSKRVLSAYRKQDLKILANKSTVFKNSGAYGNGTNLQLPLLSNGTYVNGSVQITSIEGVRYCPGSGIREVKYENDMLLHCDSPQDDTYQTIMEITDTDRDHEGGDSGYCDKAHSQSPPLKDYSNRRQRKISDIATDDGFHEASEAYINGSSPA